MLLFSEIPLHDGTETDDKSEFKAPEMGRWRWDASFTPF